MYVSGRKEYMTDTDMCLEEYAVIFNRVRVHVQVQTDIHLDTKQQTLQGVAFPMQRDAIEALEQFRNKRINYVQLVSETYVLIKEIYHYRVSYLYRLKCPCNLIICIETVIKLRTRRSKH